MNKDNVIDFMSRKVIPTPETEPTSENLLELTYSNVDEAFEIFLQHMSGELGYHEVMAGNEDLELAMGYILTVTRSAFAKSCNLEDFMTPHVEQLVESVKKDNDDDSC